MIFEKLESNRDKLPIEIAILEPVGEPVGIVQIVHGMAEHKERYFGFMAYLADKGFICAINDHRGHGASVKDKDHLGYFYTEDISYIVDDTYQLTDYLKKKYGDLDFTLFSHSMGTLVARNYLKKYDNKIDKLILCGPPTENSLASSGLVLAKITKPFYGKYSPNKLLNNISVKPYGKKFSGENSWISSDPRVVEEYNKDPLSGFIFTTNGFINLTKLLKASFNKKDWEVKNKDLPIFLIAGEDDPVIQSKEKFNDLEKYLMDLGYKNITSKLYAGKRHELLNEIGKEEVYEDIFNFII